MSLLLLFELLPLFLLLEVSSLAKELWDLYQPEKANENVNTNC